MRPFVSKKITAAYNRSMTPSIYSYRKNYGTSTVILYVSKRKRFHSSYLVKFALTPLLVQSTYISITIIEFVPIYTNLYVHRCSYNVLLLLYEGTGGWWSYLRVYVIARNSSIVWNAYDNSPFWHFLLHVTIRYYLLKTLFIEFLRLT